MRTKLLLMAASLMLLSCISVMPKSGPDPDIFRLSETLLPDIMAATPVVMVELPRTPKVLRNNRIAVAHGVQEIAYTAGARWAAPVPQMMAELLEDELLATSKLNVVSPIEGVRPRYALLTEIRHFEVVYDQGGEAAPLGRVSIRAKLINRKSRLLIAQSRFNADVRASDNRLSAIAAAVDDAAHKSGRALGAWAADQLTKAELTD